MPIELAGGGEQNMEKVHQQLGRAPEALNTYVARLEREVREAKAQLAVHEDRVGEGHVRAQGLDGEIIIPATHGQVRFYLGDRHRWIDIEHHPQLGNAILIGASDRTRVRFDCTNRAVIEVERPHERWA